MKPLQSTHATPAYLPAFHWLITLLIVRRVAKYTNTSSDSKTLAAIKHQCDHAVLQHTATAAL